MLLDFKAARHFLWKQRIQELEKAIRRAPDAPNNLDRKLELIDLKKKLEDDE